MFKSYRDIKSSLAVSREQKVPCRTAMQETALLKKLENKYGKFTDNIFTRSVVQKEKARKLKQAQSIDNAMIRLITNKVRRSLLQNERLKPLAPTATREVKPARAKAPSEGVSRFRKIEITY